MQNLQAQVAQLSESVANSRQKRTDADSDNFFKSLDAQVYPQFAHPSGEDLPQDSPNLASRKELLSKADEIASGYKIVHGSQMDQAEALHQALSIVAPDAPAAAQRRSLAESLRKRAKSRIARPTHHRTSREYAHPKEATAEALSEWERTRGLRFFRE